MYKRLIFYLRSTWQQSKTQLFNRSDNGSLMAGLLIMCIIYTISAANEYWLLNWLDSSFDVKLPIFCAILQNCTWPLQACFLIHARVNSVEERVITKSMMRGYLILGSLSSVITLSRTYGITQLPATLYVIFANTELIFEALLTRYYLKRFLYI